jgi:hypothetical protein
VGEVKLFGRTDCCGDRINGMQLRIGNDALNFANNAACFTLSQSDMNGSGRSCNGNKGRYMYLSIAGTRRRETSFSLCEVRIQTWREYHDFSLAGKTATQSSEAFGGAASRAIDGNTNGEYSACHCTHTSGENPWWKVDLGTASPTHEVLVVLVHVDSGG